MTLDYNYTITNITSLHHKCIFTIHAVLYIHYASYSLHFIPIVTEMSSDTQPIIDLSSNSDIKDALSSFTVVVHQLARHQKSLLIASDAETELLEKGKVASTPPLSPLICHRNRVVPITQPIHRIPFGRTLTTHVPPPLATYITIGRPIVHTPVLPLRCREIARKRVVFHSPLSPSSPNSPLAFHHHQFHSHHIENQLYHHITETLHKYLTYRLGSVHDLTHHYHLPYSQPLHNHIPLHCYELI